MKVAIISDIHDNLLNLGKSLNYCLEKKVSKLICLGDLSNSDTLKYLADNFSGDIFLIKGNCDTYPEKNINHKNVIYLGETARINIDGLKISLTHEEFKLKYENDFDFLFYGHSHKPWLEKINNSLKANPGNISNTRFSPTFAVLETKTKNLELILLDNL